MNVSIDCYPCLVNQILSTTRLCDLDERERKKVMDFALGVIAELPAGAYPQHVVAAVNEYLTPLVSRDGEVFDPYRNIKDSTRRVAAAFCDSIRSRIASAASPLEYAVTCAVLGNIIDFGAKNHGSLDVAAELDRVDDLAFAIYDFDALVRALEQAELLLYIGDNVGEDIFDKALITEIRSCYPEIEVVFAARDRPVINDVTVADARAIGMDQVARVISSGSVYPGTILAETSKEFKDLFDQAELVIAKGQGNFETLAGEAGSNVFFLLRAKCDKVAEHLGVELGAMVLRRGAAP